MESSPSGLWRLLGVQVGCKPSRVRLPHSPQMNYYSTNKNLPTGFKQEVSFKDALFMGLAPDEGLFMPGQIPSVSQDEVKNLKGKPYHETAFFVLNKFLSEDIESEALKQICQDAYNFKIPIEKAGEFIYLVRLDQGPTASFKDFAARFMARAMQKLKSEEDITILVATSGDTGSAVGEAYRGLEGVRVFILYPEKEVSSVQKGQLDSIGQNVRAIAVDGKFDDCQKLVKQAFVDQDLKKLNLTSANSINIGRILPQIIYYFYSYLQVAKNFEEVIFSVPSGNFGNSLGCEIAGRMGLPVKKLILAVNENDEFPKFLKSGEYHKVEPSEKCLSNAMNVGNPSNLARYFDLYGGTVDKDGIVHKQPDLEKMRKNLYSISISDRETVNTIKQVYNQYKIFLEPHGAVGYAGLQKYFEENEKSLSIVLETAAPAKFPEIIEQEIGIKPEPTESLQKMSGRKGQADYLSCDYTAFKKYLISNI